MRRPHEPPVLVPMDSDIVEYLSSALASESPEALFARLEELLDTGEYTEIEIIHHIRDLHHAR